MNIALHCQFSLSVRRLLGGLAFSLALFTSAYAQAYTENFDGGVANNWTVVNGTWTVAGSGTNKTYDSTSTSGNPEVAYYNGQSWTGDYTYSAIVKRWGSGWGNQVGLVFNYQDATHYYEVTLGGALDGSSHNLHLYEHVGAATNEVASAAFSTSGTGAIPNPCTVSVTRSGTLTTVKLNGTTFLTQSQTALSGGGKIGLADRFAAGSFDNLDVTTTLPGAWTASDIGSPSTPGSASYSNPTFFVEGAGANIWNTSDQFQFVRQSVNGDCTVVARVATMEPIANYTKAGIMIRETTAPDSKYVFLAMTPSHGLLFEARGATAASSIQPAVVTTLGLPRWLKLVRSGDTFSASYSADGVIWTTAGMVVANTSDRQATVNVKMNAGVYAGMAVTSTDTANSCIAAFESVSVTADTNYNPAFPRLGFYAISGAYSGGQAYLAETRTMLSKFHVVVLGASSEDWASGRSYTREDVVNDIHNLSMIGTKVFQYVILESINETPGLAQLPTWLSRVIANNWWLYTSGTSGAHIEGRYGQQHADLYGTVNPTQSVPNDSGTSLRPFAWGALLVHDIFVNAGGTYGLTGMAAPSLDGMYLDNVFPYASVTGDWDRDAVSSDPDDFGYNNSNNTWGTAAATAWQAAQVDYFGKINTLMPGKIQMGNTAEFANMGRPSNYTSLTPLGSLNQLLKGGLMEPAIGSGGSPETWGGPNYTLNLLNYYKYTINALAAPKLLIYEDRVTLNGTDNIDSAVNYRAARYGLATCLMNDGYYDPNNTENSTHLNVDTRWFDELSVYNGTSQALTAANVTKGLGYLGRPIANANGVAQTAPRWPGKVPYGVWAREFEGGIVIMNPRGNGAQNVTLAELGGTGKWKRILGVLNNAVNSGQPVTGDIQLQDRDALILLRQ